MTAMVFREKDPVIERVRRDAVRRSLRLRFAAYQALLPWDRPRIVEIPIWVLKADLADDYLDTLDAEGEHAAAAHCRRLTRISV